MNREIKFRAWNKEKKIMVYKNEDGSSCFWDGVDASSVELINCELNSEINRSEYEFMQYTGLKDKNGVEIYEGDIVKAYCHGEYVIGKIIYEHCGFTINVMNNEELEYGRIIILETFVEVIGNIYDNPELIEKEGK